MTDRRIDALRRLAERPGTEAEGTLAREILERFEARANAAQYGNAGEEALWDSFRDYLRGGVSLAALLEKLKEPPLTWEEKLVVEAIEAQRQRKEKQAAAKAASAALTVVVPGES